MEKPYREDGEIVTEAAQHQIEGFEVGEKQALERQGVERVLALAASTSMPSPTQNTMPGGGSYRIAKAASETQAMLIRATRHTK